MKVLHIINSLGVGGAEKLVILLVPALRRAGIDADLLVIDKHRTIFHTQLEDAGVNNTRTLGFNSFYNLLAPFKLIFALGKYDVIHSHLFPTQYWVAMAATLSQPSTPLITTEQNTTNRRRSMRFFKFLDKHIYRRYSAITTVSPIATQFLENYVNSSGTQVSTIENAIDLDAFTHVDPADLHAITNSPDAKHFAIQISTFSPQKDHDTLIKAMAHCPDSLHLILVGKGARESDMKQLAQQCGVSDRVHFIGIRNDIPALLKAADIAVLSSHYEGLSLALLEAFASGTAFVGTDAPGLGEMTERGGIKVPHKDVGQLATTLTDLVTDDELRYATGQRGLSVAADFSINKIAMRYIDVYQQVLAATT